MLKVGDKVRFKNSAIKAGAISFDNLFAKRTRKWSKKLRGSNKAMTVLNIVQGLYDWKTKKYNTLIELDIPCHFSCGEHTICSSDWVRFVRRPANSENTRILDSHQIG